MKIEPPETFSSRNMSVQRKNKFNNFFEWFGCLSAAFVDIFLIPIYLAVLSIAALFSLKNYWVKRRLCAKAKIIFDTADVYKDAVILYTRFPNRQTKEILTVKHIKKIQIRDVCVDEDVGDDIVRVFEFHHEWGQKPLLRYDIERRDVFMDLMAGKNIPFGNAL